MPEKKTERKSIRKKKTQAKHVVVFQNEDGTVLKTSFISHGQSAEPPKMPEQKGEEERHRILFDGWDQDYSIVTRNLVLKPVYRREPKKYLVMYFHENGTILGMESVPYGSPATQPYHPQKDSDGEYDYPFIGWNCSLEHIEEDTNAKAIFGKVRKIFTVRFYHEDGTLLKTEKVHYGEAAHPPVSVEKKADKIYHYRFAGWSYPTEHIKASLNIHAVFEYIFNEYMVEFFDEDELKVRQTLHYGDEIIYPKMRRKGYDLVWDKDIHSVTEHEDIHASWKFSNPVNAIIKSQQGEFQIINPSIHSGRVCCRRYFSKGEKKLVVPAAIRLGDYYYEVTEIGPYAFKECDNLKTLILPDSVRVIRDRGIAGCRFLKKILFGKNVKELGEGSFADDVKLRFVEFPGEIRSVNKEALSRAPRHLMIKMKKKNKNLC